jgi:hypothetical protein
MDFFNDSKILLYIITLITEVTHDSTPQAEKRHS